MMSGQKGGTVPLPGISDSSSLADHGRALSGCLLWSSPEWAGESQAASGGAFAGKLFES